MQALYSPVCTLHILPCAPTPSECTLSAYSPMPCSSFRLLMKEQAIITMWVLQTTRSLHPPLASPIFCLPSYSLLHSPLTLPKPPRPLPSRPAPPTCPCPLLPSPYTPPASSLPNSSHTQPCTAPLPLPYLTSSFTLCDSTSNRFL